MSLKFRFKIIYPFKHQVLYNNNSINTYKEKEVTQILCFTYYDSITYKETKGYIQYNTQNSYVTQQNRKGYYLYTIQHTTNKYLMPIYYIA